MYPYSTTFSNTFGTLFPRDIFDELDRLQQDMQQTFRGGSSIRGIGRGGFPALNVGSTPQSVELYVFAPGLEPASIDVQLDRNVLTVAGERNSDLPQQQQQQGQQGQQQDERMTLHTNERFAGRFRKVVSLPDDVDPDAVSANYRDGVLHITVKRQAAAQPRRISVQ